jgi:hypothetical protein
MMKRKRCKETEVRPVSGKVEVERGRTGEMARLCSPMYSCSMHLDPPNGVLAKEKKRSASS